MLPRRATVTKQVAAADAGGSLAVVDPADALAQLMELSTDILEAAARAYVRALSNALRRREIEAPDGGAFMAEAEEATAAAGSGSPARTP